MPMCSSFYAKFLVSTVTGHHCPFSLSLLFRSTNPFTLCPRQRAYSRIVPHQKRSFPSLLLFLHFSCILILIRHDRIVHFINAWTLGDLSLSFSLLTKTFGLIFISSLRHVRCVHHVFFTSSLTLFAMTGWPRMPDLKGTLSPSTLAYNMLSLPSCALTNVTKSFARIFTTRAWNLKNWPVCFHYYLQSFWFLYIYRSHCQYTQFWLLAFVSDSPPLSHSQ